MTRLKVDESFAFLGEFLKLLDNDNDRGKAIPADVEYFKELERLVEGINSTG